ncbi:MAG: hypothetical protein R6V32_07660 [Bacteroidales bacterium]
MLRIIKISILIFLVTVSCAQQESEEKQGVKKNKEPARIKTYSYDSLTIPAFFKSIIHNHKKDFSVKHKEKYKSVCEKFKFDAADSSNIETFYTFEMLHALFTSKTAGDNSTGSILNIPYIWHWIDPNPRQSIRMVKTGELLSDINPPNEFSKYKSYAEIDRTPYLFLSDLVEENPKYYNIQSDTFATFGWCSEREMAFVSLMKLLGYHGKVLAPGNHSWSEFIVPMVLKNGDEEKYIFIVDNTFDVFRLLKMHDSVSVADWEKDFGDRNLSRWYNRKASSEKELERIKNHIVPQKAAMRIEHRIVEYLEE